MKKSTKSILLWIVVAVIIGGTIVAAASFSSKAQEENNQNNSGNGTVQLSEPVSDEDWYMGPSDAKVTIVEYADFQCPACKNMSAVLDQIMTEFNQHVKVVYRDFPLRSIHQNAQISAQAAEAAGLQDKFWEMHDVLFDNQETWSTMKSPELEEQFAAYAEDLGLDVEKFNSDLNSSAVKNIVNEEADQAADMKLTGTPTLFINGTKIDNNDIRTYQDFRKMLIEEISK